MKKIMTWILAAAILLSGIFEGQAVYAAQAVSNDQIEASDTSLKTIKVTPDEIQITPDEIEAAGAEETTLEFWGDSNNDDYCYSLYHPEYTYSDRIYYLYTSGTNQTVTFSSSDTSVMEIDSDSKTKSLEALSGQLDTISVLPKGPGKCVVTATVGGKVVAQIPYYVVREAITITSIKQTSYNTAKLIWEKIPSCTGYIIQRATPGTQNYQEIARVTGGSNNSVEITAPWSVTYSYRVVSYLQVGADLISTSLTNNYYGDQKDFTMQKISASITSVKKSGSSALTIKWNSQKGAVSYELYRSTKENGSYKRIYRGSKTSYKQKVSKGVTYYYKLKTIYSNGLTSDYSDSVSRMIPKKSAVKQKTQTNVQQYTISGGQYGWNWSSSDSTYYYTAGGKNYMLCVQNDGNLKIYRLNNELQASLYKTIKLKYDVWGGFYQAPDGNFYVAVGYYNPKENNNKTVIKVIKYSSKWKKGKTASIKGNASNSFVGIYSPFDAGNCRMDMTGKTLYLFTCRLMYKTSDGLRHQSNISFAINTKTMKAKAANESYASHSFNQYVKFKDNTLFLVNHGDAYPRSVNLSITTGYGTSQATTTAVNLFHFRGTTGDNITGATVGGMEVGEDNVLVCGTAQPHGYAVKGVKGFGALKHNVFLVVADKSTGKSSVKWITNYHPQKTNVTVGESRMVKLADDRFAILYTTTKGTKTTFHYTVVDNNGNKKYSKKYSNITFTGSSQPLLSGGKIIWTETTYKIDYSGTITKTYSIPAVY